MTCDETCAKDGLICEPIYFPQLNTEKALKSHHIACEEYVTPPMGYEEVDYPAISGIT